MDFTRRQPDMSVEHPVRFYKVVALTFLVLTLALFAVIIFMSTKRATITIVTKAEPIEVKSSIQVNAEGDSSIAGELVTTTIALSESFSPTGTREEDGFAEGTVTLHNETGLDQPLVERTRLLSPDGVLFRMIAGATVPANGTVDVTVSADVEGTGSDIGPSDFTIPGLNETKQSVIYGKSSTAMQGGNRSIGILGATDVNKAEEMVLARLNDSAKDLLAEKHPGKTGVFALRNAEASTAAVVGTEISSFEMLGTAEVVAVFYNQDDLKKMADSLLQRRAIDDAELVKAGDDIPAATLGEYDTTAGSAALDIVYHGQATINPDSKQLDKVLFYGKTKDELRRYLLSLDHVHRVEIEIKPAWTGKVPHVPDHVDVIVKETR